MDIETAIFEIRNKTNDKDDIGLCDDEILSYLNEAIQYVSSYLISANSPLMVKEMNVEGEFELPSDFVRFAGYMPVKVTGTAGKVLDEGLVKLRYFASTKIVKLSGKMPFDNPMLNQVAIKLACIYVNAQQKLDNTQDKTLLDELNNSIAAAINGAK